MAVGHVIIVGGGSQTLARLSGLGVVCPCTGIMINLRCLSLVAFPFLSSFYSKHLMLELVFRNNVAPVRSGIIMIATGLTGAYVVRVLIHLYKRPSRAVVQGDCPASIIGCFSALSRGAVIYGGVRSALRTSFPVAPAAPLFLRISSYVVTGIGALAGALRNTQERAGARILEL